MVDLHGAVCAVRQFAYMLGAFVHGFQQGVQTFPECNIARAAPEPAGLLEIRLAKSAHWTLLSRCSFLDFLGSSDAEKQIGKCKSCPALHPFFLPATIPESHLLPFSLQHRSPEARRC